MDEFPPWLVMQTQNPVIREVLTELLQNEQLRTQLDAQFGKRDQRPSFITHVGDTAFLDQLNEGRPRRQRVKIDNNTGAASLYNGSQDGSVNAGGLFVDVDRLHEVAGQDSALARQHVRDAFLHEFAHLLPVATARNMSGRTGDPKPGAKDQVQHPVIQGENQLRGLFGLPAKTTYGLLGGN